MSEDSHRRFVVDDFEPAYVRIERDGALAPRVKAARAAVRRAGLWCLDDR